MVRIAIASVLAFALSVSAIATDATGDKNLGNGAGAQFITGACLSNADCASNCCAAFGGATGICSGPAVGDQNGKQGCGTFEGAGAAAPPPPTNNAGQACNSKRSAKFRGTN